MYPCLYDIHSRALITEQDNAIWHYWVKRIGPEAVIKTINKLRIKGRKVTFREFHEAICKELKIEV